MLNRHNSMSSIHHHHQPVMPFKWRPFDLYNDIHVNDTQSLPQQQQQHHDTNTCERLKATNCVQSYQCDFNHHNRRHSHLGLDQHRVTMCDDKVKEHLHRQQRWQRHRQNSHGSSSGSGGSSGSCASISTVGRYFVNDIDNSESNMDSTIVSCRSIDCFCCKLDGQRMMANTDKISKSHRDSDCSECYNVKCCTPNCRPDNSSKYTKIMNNINNNNNTNNCSNSSSNNSSTNKNTKNSKNLVNRVVIMPFDGIDYTYKCEQSLIGTLNHCENLTMTPTTTTTTKVSTNSNENNNNDCTLSDHCMKINRHCCHAGYFDNNWMIGHKKRPNTDNSKYSNFPCDLSFRVLWQKRIHRQFCGEIIFLPGAMKL